MNRDKGADGAPMSEARFAEILAAYGADPARWPVGERTAAARLLEVSPEAQRLVAEERALDLALDRLKDTVSVPARLQARVLASTPRPAPAEPGPVLGSRAAPGLWQRLVGLVARTADISVAPAGSVPVLAMAAALGIVVGLAGPASLLGVSDAQAIEEVDADWMLLAFGAAALDEYGQPLPLISEGYLQ